MIWLLDTNVVSEVARHTFGAAAVRMARVPRDQLATSIVVTAELRFGYTRVGSLALKRKIETVLENIIVFDWMAPCDEVYAALRSDLERRGALIGPMDLLIAAHALALDAVLVTDNEREFRRVAGLKVENWIR